MPWTTTQKMIGAIISLMSLMKPSPSGLSLMAKSGYSTPSATPTTSATTTWPKIVLKNLGTASSLELATLRSGFDPDLAPSVEQRIDCVRRRRAHGLDPHDRGIEHPA